MLFAIRHDDMETVKEILGRIDAAKLARAKNYYGKCKLLFEKHKSTGVRWRLVVEI